MRGTRARYTGGCPHCSRPDDVHLSRYAGEVGAQRRVRGRVATIVMRRAPHPRRFAPRPLPRSRRGGPCLDERPFSPCSDHRRRPCGRLLGRPAAAVRLERPHHADRQRAGAAVSPPAAIQGLVEARGRTPPTWRCVPPPSTRPTPSRCAWRPTPPPSIRKTAASRSAPANGLATTIWSWRPAHGRGCCRSPATTSPACFRCAASPMPICSRRR